MENMVMAILVGQIAYFIGKMANDVGIKFEPAALALGAMAGSGLVQLFL